MQIELNLTIDLPPTQYSITDKPSFAHQAGDILMSVFSTIILILAMIGGGLIYAVNGVGNGLSRSIDAADGALSVVDGWIIAILAWLVSALMNRTVMYAG